MRKPYSFFSPCLVRATVLLLVTAVAAGILENLALFGNEFPVVSLGFQRQLQNAEGCRVANLTCCFRRPKGAMILAPGANHEFANSVLSVQFSIRVLRGKPLVIVIVPIHHHVRAS